jgi:predicted nucleic acid-binding protein
MTDSPVATKVLVDTNILIYAADPEAGEKNLEALELLDDLTGNDRMIISAPVLNGFYHAATRPNKPPSLSHDDSGQYGPSQMPSPFCP